MSPENPTTFDLPSALAWSGESIKTTRETVGLSQKNLSEATRIRCGIIAAIEAEDFARLPGDPCLRGLLIQIARRLGLPEEELARDYLVRRNRSAADQ